MKSRKGWIKGQTWPKEGQHPPPCKHDDWACKNKPLQRKWSSEENSASNSPNPMAPPWELKKDEGYNFSTAMEL
jgi:hypothetical protein